MKIEIPGFQNAGPKLSDLKTESVCISILIKKASYKKLRLLALQQDTTASKLIRDMIDQKIKEKD